MPYDKFLVAPLKSGSQNNVKPWLINTDAYSSLINLYTWRGSVKKRAGGTLMNTAQLPPQDQLFSRFRVKIGTTDGGGAFTVAAASMPGSLYQVGQAFSVNDEIFTVNVLGTPANMLDSTGTATLATFDTTTGELVITGADTTTDVYYYPATPVTGFGSYESLGNNNSIIFGFDQQFSYNFVFSTGWNRVDNNTPGQADTWTGTDHDFFNTCNYRGTASNSFLMFITNNVPADGFRYWDGADFFQLGTAGTTPINVANDYIVTAKMVLPFKDRLLLLNVTENISTVNQTFQNRIRFSEFGSPIETTSWRQDIPGRGSFIDAPIIDSITSAEFLKDRLIVYFENSTWELVYTGNTLDPFRFQKINTELGSESLNSTIPFDQVVVAFGPNGINQCNGINVNRIDDLIPQEIFSVNNSNFGPDRVAGIRDYYIEIVYWAFNSTAESDAYNNIYPNIVLVYNYKTNNWAYNTDSITAFGNFFLQNEVLWQDANKTWEEDQQTWAQTLNTNKFLSIIAGNQQGYTFIVDSDSSINSKAMQITDIAINGSQLVITAMNHNLPNLSYVFITDVVSLDGTMGNINGSIFQVSTTSLNTFEISTGTDVLTGTYSGGGVVTRVSNMFLQSKQYNFYNNVGCNTAINRVDYYVDKTDNGQVEVQWYISSSNVNFLLDDFNNGTLVGKSQLLTFPNALTPLEDTQDRFWRPIYFNANGETYSFILTLNELQILVPAIAFSDFQLNAFIVHAMKTSEVGS